MNEGYKKMTAIMLFELSFNIYFPRTNINIFNHSQNRFEISCNVLIEFINYAELYAANKHERESLSSVLLQKAFILCAAKINFSWVVQIVIKFCSISSFIKALFESHKFV